MFIYSGINVKDLNVFKGLVYSKTKTFWSWCFNTRTPKSLKYYLEWACQQVFQLASHNLPSNFWIKHNTPFDQLCVSANSGFSISFAFSLEERRALEGETKVPKWAKVLFASKSARAELALGGASLDAGWREATWQYWQYSAHLCFPINSRKRAWSSLLFLSLAWPAIIPLTPPSCTLCSLSFPTTCYGERATGHSLLTAPAIYRGSLILPAHITDGLLLVGSRVFAETACER